MRRFKVLKCKQEKTVGEIRTKRDKDGNLISYKVYRVVKAGDEGWYPGAYGVEKIKEGDIIEVGGHLADKAAANPHFEEVFTIEQAPQKKVSKKKAA